MSSINQWFAGTSGGQGATSPDCATWTIQSGFATAFGAHQVNNAYHNRNFASPRWVVVGNGGVAATSTDGVSWTGITIGFSTTNINAVAYDPSLTTWVAVGASKKAFYCTSPTGTWTACTLPGGWSGSTVITGVASDIAGHFMIAGFDGSTAVAAQSSDGHTFSSVTLSALTGTITAMIHDHVGKWVVATSASEVATSTNRTSWTTQSNTSNHTFGPSSLCSDELLSGTGYWFGSTSQHVYYTTDFSSYSDQEASPGSGATNLCVASDGQGLYAVAGTPIGSAELVYQNTGSSLGTTVVIGFSAGVSALAHSNFGNIIGLNDNFQGDGEFSSFYNGGITLSDSGVVEDDSFFLVGVIQALTVTGNSTVALTQKWIANLLAQANSTATATNKASLINGVVATSAVENAVGIFFVNQLALTANATSSVSAVYNAIEYIVAKAVAQTSATSIGALANAVIVVGVANSVGVYGFYQSVSDTAAGTINQVNSIDALGSVADSAVAQAIVTNHLSVPILLLNAANVEDALGIKQLLINFIHAGGVVALDISLGGTDYTAWVLNTKTLGATPYTNFEFNSFAKLGGVTYAAKTDGIYSLGGTDDAGTKIVAEARTGLLKLGNGNEVRVPEAFIAAKTNGDLVMKVVTSEPSGIKIENWYAVEPRVATALRTTRVKIGRGLKSAYWQFALCNVDGSTLELANLELMPVILDRRIS